MKPTFFNSYKELLDKASEEMIAVVKNPSTPIPVYTWSYKAFYAWLETRDGRHCIYRDKVLLRHEADYAGVIPSDAAYERLYEAYKLYNKKPSNIAVAS